MTWYTYLLRCSPTCSMRWLGRPARYCHMFLAAAKCGSGEPISGISRVLLPSRYDFGGLDLTAIAQGAGRDVSASHPSCAPF